MFDIDEELKKLPADPGVYMMFDKNDTIIYIGKAKILKNRVRQYFQNRSKGAKIDHMVTHIARFEYIITDSELEALILECNLIKEHRPKYNTMLTDDKTYPFIKVTVSETYPRVFLTRKMVKDGSKYFGPYVNVTAARETLDLLHKVYLLRSCRGTLPDEKRKRTCLNYHIKRCSGPCQAYISSEEYKKNVEKVIGFLSGNSSDIEREIKVRMQAASYAMEYEKAAEYLELLKQVQAITIKQKMTQSDADDKDIIAVAMDEKDAVVQIFFIRGGKLIGREHYFLHIGEYAETEDKLQSVLEDFITQFYSGTPYLPKYIMLQCQLDEQELLEEWLSQKRGLKVYITYPKIGMKERLVELAKENAELILKKDKRKLEEEEKRTIGAVAELEEMLGLSEVKRIEAFDISNINGFEMVGSMVVFENGKPKKSDYRKFKIKSFKGQDDTRALQEVLSRRFERGKSEIAEGKDFSGFTKFPDIILMDGGKGQIHAAEEVLSRLNINIPICGMVKDEHHRTRGIIYEELEYTPSMNAFNLVTRIQDEAHRFAITYHRSLRGNAQVHSVLDDISLIGPERRKALMREFDSIEAIKQASVEELSKISGMTLNAAESVFEFFHKKE